MLRRMLISAGLLAALAPLAHATDLWQVWQLAKANDPAFKQAAANRNASMEAKPQAWAQLMPSIDLNASRTWDNNASDRLNFFGSQVVPVNSSSNTTENQWGAQLTQTLFNWQRITALQGADYSVAQAQATYEATTQNLIVSVAQAYFNVLNARDVLDADTANQQALSKQYEQSQQQYKVGLAAITGVKQSEAAYEQARAQVIADRQSLAQAEEALRAITGRYIKDLEAPKSKLPLNPPDPHSAKAWVKRGLDQNPNLMAAQMSQKAAQNQVTQQEGGYMPSVNLVLQHTHQATGGNSSYYVPGGGSTRSPADSHSTDNQIGLQLSWNIFNGGATRSSVKQSQYQADAAMAQEISQRRSVEQNVRNAYLAVLSGIAQVQATRQSVASSKVSLQATQAGLKVGTQTVLDVLTSRKDLLSAQKSYYNARYGYLVSVLQLEQAAGTLSPDDIKRLNAWLVPRSAAPSATAMPAASAAAPMSAPAPLTAD